MTTIHTHLRALEAYIERCGVRLVRTALPDFVHGRTCSNLIMLRAGLNPLQELSALVHEVAHWLAHRDAWTDLYRTLFEYEAEAVEVLVMARLKLSRPADNRIPSAYDSPTDGLLMASVARVNWASDQICEALGVPAVAMSSEAQAPIDVETAARKEIIFEYEPYGMSDFLWSPEPL